MALERLRFRAGMIASLVHFLLWSNVGWMVGLGACLFHAASAFNLS
jgi:hypothetical protein